MNNPDRFEQFDCPTDAKLADMLHLLIQERRQFTVCPDPRGSGWTVGSPRGRTELPDQPVRA